jgi:hypothetical protein
VDEKWYFMSFVCVQGTSTTWGSHVYHGEHPFMLVKKWSMESSMGAVRSSYAILFFCELPDGKWTETHMLAPEKT